MIKKILFATDLGMYGPYVLQQVMDIAHQATAEVEVLHVVEPMGVFAESILETYLPEEDKAKLRRSGIEGIMRGIQTRVEDTLRNEYLDEKEQGSALTVVLVERGEAAETICKLAIERNVDLIVIGNHGQNSKGRAVGAVAVKVLQISSIPVLMIPMGPLEPSTKGSH